MDAKNKIRLVTSDSFELPSEEIKNLYTYMALFQYRFLRVPQYNEKVLLTKLNEDFKKFSQETQKLYEQNPNNHALNRVCSFFNNHYKNLKTILEQDAASRSNSCANS